MATELIINVTSFESRAALIENGNIVELHIEREAESSLVGNIYKGRVIKVLPGMGAAFIDIGLERSAFLYVGDVVEHYADFYAEWQREEECLAENALGAPLSFPQPCHIEDILQEGQEVLVQVAKPPLVRQGCAVDFPYHSARPSSGPDAHRESYRGLPADQRRGRAL